MTAESPLPAGALSDQTSKGLPHGSRRAAVWQPLGVAGLITLRTALGDGDPR